MTSLTVEELQQILDKTGLSKNAIEKKFGMGQGSIGKFLTGKLNSLPDKYVAKIRKLGEGEKSEASMIPLTSDNTYANNSITDFDIEVYKSKLKIEEDYTEEPIGVEDDLNTYKESEETKKDASLSLQFVEDAYKRHSKDIKRPLIDKNLLP